MNMYKTAPVLEVGETDTLRDNSMTWNPLGEAQTEEEPSSFGGRRGGKRDPLRSLLRGRRCVIDAHGQGPEQGPREKAWLGLRVPC